MRVWACATLIGRVAADKHIRWWSDRFVCFAAARPDISGRGLLVTVQWADGVDKEVHYEILKRNLKSSNALLEWLVARVKKRK